MASALTSDCTSSQTRAISGMSDGRSARYLRHGRAVQSLLRRPFRIAATSTTTKSNNSGPDQNGDADIQSGDRFERQWHAAHGT